MPKQIHVVKHGKNWAVKQDKAQRASAIAPTQRKAFERARDIARKQRESIVMGKIPSHPKANRT